MAADVQTAAAAEVPPRGDGGQAARRIFFATGALLFAAAAWLTIARSNGMSMAGMPMPGGWTMSMAWMRMPGQNWLAATATFLGMWSPMMVAMMLPSLLPTLWRFHQAVGHAGGMRQAGLVARVAIAYFLVWSALGLVIFPAGAALAAMLMHWPALSRAAPAAATVIVLAAATLQFTPWKARRLASCCGMPKNLAADTASAWRHGLRLGARCVHCCAGLAAAQLSIGVMDLGVMAVVAAIITAERLSLPGKGPARFSTGPHHTSRSRTDQASGS
ncbi:Predicted metal-binding membrane protein [Frateuria terrea]|uniref:Predicted metal-binding membrane protein n=2 Tax=Frateuria terrea TaxID=529704 RepID=A0A1H6SMH9_9GAMM|nr:Predicted metal-binding membrane protein [Frateuria terrea]SFP26960.1 Predicted metal-binding membrane protein [Frateuria terrea]